VGDLHAEKGVPTARRCRQRVVHDDVIALLVEDTTNLLEVGLGQHQPVGVLQRRTHDRTVCVKSRTQLLEPLHTHKTVTTTTRRTTIWVPHACPRRRDEHCRPRHPDHDALARHHQLPHSPQSSPRRYAPHASPCARHCPAISPETRRVIVPHPAAPSRRAFARPPFRRALLQRPELERHRSRPPPHHPPRGCESPCRSPPRSTTRCPPRRI